MVSCGDLLMIGFVLMDWSVSIPFALSACTSETFC